jgi:hypothetical protein
VQPSSPMAEKKEKEEKEEDGIFENQSLFRFNPYT